MKSTVRTAVIEVFGDFACPWCYIMTRRLRAALQFLTPRVRGRLEWHALPMGRAAAERALAQPDTRGFLTGVGVAEGIGFALDRIGRIPDTTAAHNLVSRVKRSGHVSEIVDQLVERIYRAVWSEGRDIENPATLAELGAAAGVDAAVRNVGAAYPVDLLADQSRAAALEIDSIPFVLINDRVGVRGTRSTRHLTEAIEGASWFDEGRASARVGGVA